MKDTEAALKWIVSILHSKQIQFQIRGGFAAMLYGSSRELVDIDIDIHNTDFEKILGDVKNDIVFGPDQYTDENWNFKLMTLEYQGQLIDITGEAQIFDRNNSRWVDQAVDYTKSSHMNIYGITVPVIRKEDLVAYKAKLLRDVDKKDIESLRP